MRPPRVVLDTHCVVSALVFAKGRFAPMRLAWQQGQFTPLVSRDTAAELLRVLAYPRLKLSLADQHTLLADYLPWAQTVQVQGTPTGLPPVRDGHDVMFLALGRTAQADALITGDGDLLEVRAQFDIPILTVAEFDDWLRQRH